MGRSSIPSTAPAAMASILRDNLTTRRGVLTESCRRHLMMHQVTPGITQTGTDRHCPRWACGGRAGLRDRHARVRISAERRRGPGCPATHQGRMARARTSLSKCPVGGRPSVAFRAPAQMVRGRHTTPSRLVHQVGGPPSSREVRVCSPLPRWRRRSSLPASCSRSRLQAWQGRL